jgi:hypothetical protein
MISPETLQFIDEMEIGYREYLRMNQDVDPAAIERALAIGREFAERIFPTTAMPGALNAVVLAELPRPSPEYGLHEPTVCFAASESFDQRWLELETAGA